MKKISLLKNEKGSVVVLAMVMLVLLTLLGMAVTRTSSIEVQIASNDQQAADCLYKAESADHYAIEASPQWMTNAFLTAAPPYNTAYYIIPDPDTGFDLDGDGFDDVSFDMDGDGVNDANFDIDQDGINDVRIEVRCIEGTGTPVTPPNALSNAAEDLPVLDHISIPPIGSGYSLKHFEVRRYGITGTASNGCSVVQMGAYKVFNKFN